MCPGELTFPVCAASLKVQLKLSAKAGHTGIFLNPWSRKIPHAAGLSLCATSTEPAEPEPLSSRVMQLCSCALQ